MTMSREILRNPSLRSDERTRALYRSALTLERKRRRDRRRAALREAFRFHLEHGGYCTPPGRAACALLAAHAELAGHERGWELRCESDADGWARYGLNGDEGPYWVAVLAAPAEHWNECDRILVTLGGVDVSDDEAPDYWRTLYAELASEALSEEHASREAATA